MGDNRVEKVRRRVDRIILRSMTVVPAVILGIPVLLFLGLIYNFFSPSQLGIGILVWFAAVILLAAIKKRAENKHPPLTASTKTMPDNDEHTRIVRDIRRKKVWIGFLAIAIFLGLANGISHNAWLARQSGPELVYFGSMRPHVK